jgi:hypothetical protein
MTRIALAGLLGFLLAAAPDDRDDLEKAAEKTRELENYGFKGRIKVEGVPFLADPVEYAGAYAKDRGFHATMGPFGSLFRLDKKVAVKDPESGTWILLRSGSKVGEGPLAAEIPIIARGLRPPHEELKKFEKRFKDVRKKDGGGKVGGVSCTVYEGALTEAGVRASLPAGAGALLGKGTYEGTGRAWIDDTGRILRFDSDGQIQIEDKDKTIDIAFSRTTEFTDIGKARVDMPAEVKKLLED